MSLIDRGRVKTLRVEWRVALLVCDLGTPIEVVAVSVRQIAVLLVVNHDTVNHDVIRIALVVRIIRDKSEPASYGGFQI